MERQGDVVWHVETVVAVERAWVVPHLCVVNKNREGYLRRKQCQRQTRPQAQGSSVGKLNPHNFWL